ncbi:acetoacetate decarboxylase family protein [Gordonia sp. PDNC005]|jgi:hypothetical protein|uniref:acetoacetate decarboxylase family protein n=1 Tax=unclassified Gordonia (in: high G+C Gram-positive bacteria) TaxID=2657482 RepID=UPI001964592B|nr:acetoacetate decarboxylase family protein [Gordonia sp. PDNC005]QRY61565.1 acetoacetate decarboxylase family protein [Gordonia sp. PDNC005]
MTFSSHTVLGTSVSMPVEIRSARCFMAGFSASATAVDRAIAERGDSDLKPLQVRPGRTMCMLVFVDYIDGDLGPYNEFGVCFLVEDPGSTRPSKLGALRSLVKGDAHALIHELPVDGDFTLAAGRGIWGFPKVLADFDVDHTSPIKTGRVLQDGKLIAELDVRRGISVPDNSSEAVLQSYAQLDGVTRRTPWRLTSTTGTRTRIGGATLRLGDHPMADELRRLKLSRHALMSSSVSDLSMRFEDAVVITRP